MMITEAYAGMNNSERMAELLRVENDRNHAVAAYADALRSHAHAAAPVGDRHSGQRAWERERYHARTTRVSEARVKVRELQLRRDVLAILIGVHDSIVQQIVDTGAVPWSIHSTEEARAEIISTARVRVVELVSGAGVAW